MMKEKNDGDSIVEIFERRNSEKLLLKINLYIKN